MQRSTRTDGFCSPSKAPGGLDYEMTARSALEAGNNFRTTSVSATTSIAQHILAYLRTDGLVGYARLDAWSRQALLTLGMYIIVLERPGSSRWLTTTNACLAACEERESRHLACTLLPWGGLRLVFYPDNSAFILIPRLAHMRYGRFVHDLVPSDLANNRKWWICFRLRSGSSDGPCDMVWIESLRRSSARADDIPFELPPYLMLRVSYFR